ncbi:HhH-GPD family protein, partial [Halovivax asiaticus JCM 14624]
MDSRSDIDGPVTAGHFFSPSLSSGMSEEPDDSPADGDEPAVNISGGADGGGTAAGFDPGTADTRTERVVDRLGELYWQKTYGGQDAFTC